MGAIEASAVYSFSPRIRPTNQASFVEIVERHRFFYVPNDRDAIFRIPAGRCRNSNFPRRREQQIRVP